MDVKALKEITNELSLLYVEDDDNLRAETVKLFQHLFNDVDSANNGQVGLDKVLVKDYDIVVTDINMPVMGGVELCKHIKEHRPQLPILITSAHDESHYLLELIDIGIDKFILKPLVMGQLTATLFRICTNISNKKMLAKYKQEIEQTNLNLKSSNEELRVLVQILDKKIEQLNTSEVSNSDLAPLKDAINRVSHKAPHPQYNMDFQAPTNDEGLLLFTDYLHKEDLDKVHTFHTNINTLSTLQYPSSIFDKDNILVLAKILNEYGDILQNYNIFSNLGAKVTNLSHVIQENTQCFLEQLNDVSILLESFLYVFKKWKSALFSDGIKNPNMYDTSMINDIETISILLQKEECLPKQNLDFF